jgi:light-regulated signal transduction histidine kinase (bacteriophytochrome)
VGEVEVERLRARIVALEHEKESLEAFAAVAAHELLEPLILTESYAVLVSERLGGSGHEQSRDDLANLSCSARRMRLLVETLLVDARTGTTAIDRHPVDLNKVVRGSLAPLQSEVRERNATVEIDDLPVVRGEETLIASIYTNLLINGLKFSPRDKTVIRVGFVSSQADDPELFVESNAPTISAKDRGRIFEPFKRGRDERRTRGVGLGLAICRSMVERHGGRIWVGPGAAGGNRFSFTLPG